MLEILSCNCDDLDRDIVAELKDLALEYNSEFVNLSENNKLAIKVCNKGGRANLLAAPNNSFKASVKHLIKIYIELLIKELV